VRFVSFAVLSVAFAVSEAAQTPSATVVGRVTDPTGAVIPGVAIHVTNVDTNISQRGSSNEAGDFTIPYLNPAAIRPPRHKGCFGNRQFPRCLLARIRRLAARPPRFTGQLPDGPSSRSNPLPDRVN
jgi:hypothetical protein